MQLVPALFHHSQLNELCDILSVHVICLLLFSNKKHMRLSFNPFNMLPTQGEKDTVAKKSCCESTPQVLGEIQGMSSHRKHNYSALLHEVDKVCKLFLLADLLRILEIKCLAYTSSHVSFHLIPI